MKKIINILLLLLLFAGSSFAQNTPYVILISFDGFRWDYSNRGITPNLQKMKNAGVSALSLRPVFPSKTFPNHYSIITGMYADHHGIISNHFTNPFTDEKYSMGDLGSKRNGKWYLGEAFWETAQRNNIISASIFWPGSEIEIPEYRHPKYYYNYNEDMPYYARVNQIIDWLKLPDTERPHFITAYFEDTDTYGHDFGPNSKEINVSIARLDSLVGYLYSELENINMQDSVDLIIVSDHGMTEISKEKSINIEKLLDGFDCNIQDSGPFMRIDPPAGKEKEVYNYLLEHKNHYKVYTKENIPSFYHYSENPFISDVILIADPGRSLLTNWGKNWEKSKGDHGYENNFLDMNGTFIAAGPDFKVNFKTGTLWNIDIYPLLAEIFHISPRSNIDGKLERIEFILRGK